MKPLHHLSIIFILLTFNATAQEKSLVLEDLNPAVYNMNFANYDQKTALFCAQLSNLVYYDKGDIDLRINTLRCMYPNDNIHYEFIRDKNDTDPGNQAANPNGKKEKKVTTYNELMFFGTSKFVVIAFRGTYDMKDWRTNLKRKTIKGGEADGTDIPGGHRGFRISIQNLIRDGLLDKLKQFIGQYTTDIKNFPVYVTGHSLGAALATFSIQPLKKDFSFKGCYNFAPPFAIACADYAKFISDSNLIYDIVNYRDIITRFNYKSLRHVGKFYRLCKYDDAYPDMADGSLCYEKERLLKFKTKVVGPNTILRYHRIDRYIERLKLDVNNTEKVIARGYDNNPGTRGMEARERGECD